MTVPDGELSTSLQGFPLREGLIHVSEARDYDLEESDYDAAHNVDPHFAAAGIGLVELLRTTGAPFDGPALELGCGTGMLSVGLISANVYPELLISDPSPRFAEIARQKAVANHCALGAASFGVLLAEDLGRLPSDLFALIVLRSCLHHIVDIQGFLRDAARALRPGGVLSFQEPCAEGFVLMATLLRTLPDLAKWTGRKLSREDRRRVEAFVHMVDFLVRSDHDKHQAEDKHLFRVDELMTQGREVGLEVTFFRNRAYEHFSVPEASRGPEDTFRSFFDSYLRYLLQWPDSLISYVSKHLASSARLLDELEAGGNPIHLHGCFTCVKR